MYLQDYGYMYKTRIDHHLIEILKNQQLWDSLLLKIKIRRNKRENNPRTFAILLSWLLFFEIAEEKLLL